MTNDDGALRRLVREASEALLQLNHAVNRRAAGIRHPPINELMAAAGTAHTRMMLELERRGDDISPNFPHNPQLG